MCWLTRMERLALFAGSSWGDRMIKNHLRFMLFMVLVCALNGCRFFLATPEPWLQAQNWYCEEINMTIQFDVDEKGNLTDKSIGRLIVNDEVFEVAIGTRKSVIGFLADENHDGFWDLVLDGSWKYDQGILVIQIAQESIFGGKYTELEFVPVTETASQG